MTWRLFAAVVVSWLLASAAPSAQAPQSKNPFEGNPEAILAGMGGYRLRCADCHGTDGRGVRGPDITQVWNTGRTDEGLFKTIRRGVPNSRDAGVRGAAHLRSRRVADARVPEDAGRAGGRRSAARQRRERREGVSRAVRRLPQRQRHRRPARSRSVAHRHRPARATCWLARIRRGSEDFRAGFEPVTVTPPDGKPIQGVKKNEDLFSVQIMDTRERIQGYEKDKVKAVENGQQVGDADVRSRSPERQRPRRSAPLSADASRLQPRGKAIREPMRILHVFAVCRSSARRRRDRASSRRRHASRSRKSRKACRPTDRAG